MLGLYHLLSSGWGLTVALQYCCGLDFVPSMYYSRLVYDIDNLLDDRDNFFSSSFEDEMKKRYSEYTPKTKRSEVCSSAIKVLVSLCNCDVDLFYVAMNEPQAFVMDLIQNAMTNRNKDLYSDSRYRILYNALYDYSKGFCKYLAGFGVPDATIKSRRTDAIGTVQKHLKNFVTPSSLVVNSVGSFKH